MNDLRQAAQQALAALETCSEDEWHSDDDFGMMQVYDEAKVTQAITALRAALAEPEQEPVAWMYDFLNPDNREEVIRNWVTQNPDDIEREKGFNVRPLYTAPTPNTLEESNGKD